MKKIFIGLFFISVAINLVAQYDVATTDSVVYHNYKSNSGSWYVSAKYIYTHSDTDNKVTERVWAVDPLSSSYDLEPTLKNIYDFDAQGNITLLESYEWVDGTGEWFGLDKTIFEYNTNNVLIKKTIYSWDYDLVIWEPKSRVNYYPTDGSGVSMPTQKSTLLAKVYPNPTKNFVMVKVGASPEAKIELFDIHGRPLLKKEFESELLLPLQNLTPGVYIYRLRQRGQMQTGRVVVE